MSAPKKFLWALLVIIGILIVLMARSSRQALHSAILLRDTIPTSATAPVQDLLLSAFWTGFCGGLLVVVLTLFFIILIRGKLYVS